MAETEIKKNSTKYILKQGKYCVFVEIDHNINKISIIPGTGNKPYFIFSSSIPEMVYIIGTLIRDAADLISTDRAD